ncbi:MAG TPA: hypothetical protein PLQ89_12840 [Phycisphaerae bacterium]|nr:hypothetical protein [Phycisphaerae bacterium]
MEGERAIDNAPLMTTGQFARRIGLHRHQVTHLIDTKRLPDAQLWIGGRRLFSQAEALAAAEYLKQQKQVAENRKGVKTKCDM